MHNYYCPLIIVVHSFTAFKTVQHNSHSIIIHRILCGTALAYHCNGVFRRIFTLGTYTNTCVSSKKFIFPKWHHLECFTQLYASSVSLLITALLAFGSYCAYESSELHWFFSPLVCIPGVLCSKTIGLCFLVFILSGSFYYMCMPWRWFRRHSANIIPRSVPVLMQKIPKVHVERI